MRSHRLGLILLSASVLAATACAGPPAAPAPPPAAIAPAPPPAPTPSPPPAPERVRISRSQGLGNVLEIARARGYLQEQGIELDEQIFASTADAIPALSSGDLDAGSTTPNASLFNAFARGIRLVLALDSSHVDPRTRAVPLLARATPDGSVIQGPADLRGKTVGQNQRGVINEWALDRMLAEVGLRPDDVETAIMPFPDMLAAFGGGSVDAAIMPEPFGTIAEERRLAVRLRDAGDYIPGGQVAAIAFSERFARERQDAARRFAVAYLRGVRDYMDAMEHGRDREAIIGILAQAANMDPRIADKAGYFPINRDGRVNAETTGAMLDWMVQRGYVSQKPDLAALLDPRFADHAAHTLDRR